MKHRYLKKTLAFMLTAVSVAGILGNGNIVKAEDSKEELNQAKELNIAYQPVIGFLPLYVLKDSDELQNALKEAGYDDIEVNFTEFESGPPENEAFASGLQDIGVMGNVPAVSGIAAGQERSIIGIAYNGEQTEAVLVPEDSDITSVKDLKGKKIGLVVGSIAQNFIDVLLKENDLTTQDVELINLSTGEQQQALAAGQVDAIATWEPTITKTEAAKTGKILADGTDIFLGENPIVARTEYTTQNPEIVQIFLEEYKEAVDELNKNKAEYEEKYAETLGLDVDLLDTALSHVSEPVTISEEDITDLQGTADFLYDSGIITKSLNIADYIDDTFSKNLN